MPGYDYLHYSAEDFAQDDWFVRWVLTPDAETEAFWQNWLTTYPFRRDEVELARQLLLSLHQLPQARLTTAEKIELKQRIFTEIAPQEQPTLSRAPRTAWYWAAAAALLLALLGGWWQWQARQATPAESYAALLQEAQQTGALQTVRNPGAAVRLVNLPDGSSVLLQANSQLAFPAQFSGASRTVYLSGEAFFEVAKNPRQPFFVNTTSLVTKVLGTSFTVQAWPGAATAVVQVKTGRVSVYPRQSAEARAQARSRKLEGFVLVPNQQATYRLTDRKLLRALVPRPALQPGRAPAPTFEYAETPLRRVFAQLEQAYGVDIIYDEATLGSCPLTASLSDEPLFEKLNLICKAVRANYEVLDTQIVVTGPGCH